MSEFPFQHDPDAAQSLRDAAERHDMKLEEFKHAVQRLWDELDEDQLQTLSTMFHILAYSSGSRKTAAQWEGITCTYLKFRFGICITCGVNHEKEILTEPSIETQESTSEKDDDMEYFSEHKMVPLTFSLTQRAKMLEYHIDDAYEDETGKFIGFICTGIKGMKGGCGLMYPSIEDRMLKEPENCHGCYEKVAHG